jgi:transcriptional regulator with XRE-family HTH domain
MNIKEYVGNQIHKRRKAAKFNQEQLAEYLGMTRTSIVNIEAGRQGVPLDTFWKICNFLHCQPNDLLPETQVVEWDYEEVEKVIYERVPKTIKVRKLKLKDTSKNEPIGE